jgi:hypothetical protein
VKEEILTNSGAGALVEDFGVVTNRKPENRPKTPSTYLTQQGLLNMSKVFLFLIYPRAIVFL